MPADQRIQMAKDGVAEVSMTDARAALTALIREVSWGGRPGAFTERGKRVAMVLPAESYEDIATLRELRGYLDDLDATDTPQAKHEARVIREALELAKGRALDSS